MGISGRLLRWALQRSKAMDCSHPRHPQVGTPGREQRSSRRELTSDDLREIESAASKITVQGARYPEHLERMTNL